MSLIICHMILVISSPTIYNLQKLITIYNCERVTINKCQHVFLRHLPSISTIGLRTRILSTAVVVAEAKQRSETLDKLVGRRRRLLNLTLRKMLEFDVIDNLRFLRGRGDEDIMAAADMVVSRCFSVSIAVAAPSLPLW